MKVLGFSRIAGDTSHSSQLMGGMHLYPLQIFLSFVSHAASQGGRIGQLIHPYGTEGNWILPQSGRAGILGGWQVLPYPPTIPSTILVDGMVGSSVSGVPIGLGWVSSTSNMAVEMVGSTGGIPVGPGWASSSTSALDVEDKAVVLSVSESPIGLGWVSSWNSALDVEDEVVRSSTGELPMGLGWVSLTVALGEAFTRPLKTLQLWNVVCFPICHLSSCMLITKRQGSLGASGLASLTQYWSACA